VETREHPTPIVGLSVWKGGKGHTEDDNVEDQDDEAEDATASAVLPGVVEGVRVDILGHGGSEGEGSQAELEEEGVDVLNHDVGRHNAVVEAQDSMNFEVLMVESLTA
jgi:hypothetical protein